MTSLESIEKLRELRDETASKMVDNPRWVCARAEEIADEVEREIAEKYMELPVDADGVPIRLDDRMKRIATGWECTVSAVSDGAFYAPEGGCKLHKADSFIHVKPRTVEDVLRDCCNEWNEHCGDDWESGVYAKYADELRKLIKEGGDD